jgi:membrane-bound inhibitor of C-type lysozyme
MRGLLAGASVAAMLVALATPALADVSIGVGLDISGDAQVKTSIYDCKGHDPITVQYLDVAPNFLALVPVDGPKPLIFVNVISASGAKYESGQYVWWNKGSEATLSDVTEGLDAAPVLSCSEQIDTP